MEQGTETLVGAAYEGGAYGGVRVDTGVYEGGEIPMFYDSMIAKLIVHGRDRNDAIAKMREALNGFVIRGISSNIPFQAALLAHPKFVAGDFNTGFIAEHYGQGLSSAEDVPHDDPLFLVALAAFVRRKARQRASGISGQLPGHGVTIAPDFVVAVLGEQGQHVYHAVTVDSYDTGTASAIVRVGERGYSIASPSKLGDALMQGVVNGRPFTAQVGQATARRPLALRVAHNGTQIDALVLSAARSRADEADALQGAARHQQDAAVADAGPAGRRGGAGRARR